VIAFTRESIAACMVEAKALVEQHYHEIAHYPDIPLDPDWDTYLKAEHAGAVRAYFVRDDGTLRGYAIFFVRPNMHYKTSLQANQDILYIDRSLRGTTPLRFIKWCDAQLKAEGCQVVYHHVKVAHDFGPILKRMGYEAIDTIWGKRLDKE